MRRKIGCALLLCSVVLVAGVVVHGFYGPQTHLTPHGSGIVGHPPPAAIRLA